MRRLLLVALLGLTGCYLRYVSGNASRVSDPVTVTPPGTPGVIAGPGVVITIDGSAGELCSPDDTDPQHTCPAKAGTDQP